jgi:hypothetical protein
VAEGVGIDARTKADPKEEAEKKTKTVAGAPGGAAGRVSLLQSTLICDLPQFLVETVLENPAVKAQEHQSFVERTTLVIVFSG